MQKEFTHQFMQDNCGCYSEDQLNACSFMKKEIVALNDILNSEIPLRDKFWFVCRKLATKEQNQMIAIGVTEIVLPIFEKKYPEDKRPREAVEAAKQYIAGHISFDELMRKRAAAYAAYADYAAPDYIAASPAIAASYAATAAYADRADNYAASDAARAAARADNAAAIAADDIKQQLLNLLIDFCEKA